MPVFLIQRAMIPYIIPIGDTASDGTQTKMEDMRMPKRRPREIKVTVSFEPNRLEEQNVSAAYELVLPVRQGLQRSLQKREITRHNMKAQQLEIFSLAANQ